jgi:hypothetical protein
MLMIALPVATVWTMKRPGNPEDGLDGAISKAFLDADARGGPSSSYQAVPAAAGLLPKGMPESAVFQTLAASAFTCATDDNAATCFRAHDTTTCQNDWTMRLIFSDDGTVWSSTAKRQAICR